MVQFEDGLVLISLTNLLARSNQFVFLTFFFVDKLTHEKEKFKAVSDDLDMTYQEMSAY